MNLLGKRSSIAFLLALVLIFVPLVPVIFRNSDNQEYVDEKDINQLVHSIMDKSGVPGVSIAIVKDNKTDYLSFGSANAELNKSINESTLFEIASLSKAFTALAVFHLEGQGKISLNDPVSKYIPWLNMRYNGMYRGEKHEGTVNVTLADLLYHTSGIPNETTGRIPEGSTDDMLEKTVRILQDKELDFYPGDKFQYASLNYDVLGYIIQEVSGVSFEKYVRESIMIPLGLNNSYAYTEELTGAMATGYKKVFMSTRTYNAPRYRGNTPAGYIVSNAEDMSRWMRIQLGMEKVPEEYQRIIEKSHVYNTSVAPEGGFYYSGGWNVSMKGLEINHVGGNPNYSSMIILKPNQSYGICVMTNMGTNAAIYLANNISNLLEGKTVEKYTAFFNGKIDAVFTLVCFGSVVVGGFYFVLSALMIVEFFKKKRVVMHTSESYAVYVGLSLLLICYFGYCLYRLPEFFFEGLPWSNVSVWASPSVILGCILAYAMFAVFILYMLLSYRLRKRNEKGYFSLIPLSLINGISNAMIIFTINEVFNRNMNSIQELMLYFLLALFIFVFTIKMMQSRLIDVSNETVYETRTGIIKRVLESSYQSIEKVGKERIYSGINNDCSSISELPAVLVNLSSGVLTLLFCLLYLFTKNIYGFYVSFGIIVINGIISLITSRIARKHWEKTRDIQDIYFRQIHDLIHGFKELILNKHRRLDFWRDNLNYTRLSTDLSKEASKKFLNFNLYNTIMYNMVFGIVVFILPLLISSFDANQVRENLFIVFYMVGPFNAIMTSLPQLTKLRVSMNRIKKLTQELDETSDNDLQSDSLAAASDEMSYGRLETIEISLHDIVYAYDRENNGDVENSFALGPISATFRSSEIVFITGGNGSGKSTLGKIITGLYKPQSGYISLNGSVIESRELNDLFSSVYSDFYLFKKLYGIDYMKMKDEFDQYLKTMRLDDHIKVINDMEFASISNLSTGQKKRLAYIISCIEHKPMMIFDEWAAEQDPNFRHFFYHELLPALKEQGRGIIVITHDDRYFDLSDKLIRMEFGEIVNDKSYPDNNR